MKNLLISILLGVVCFVFAVISGSQLNVVLGLPAFLIFFVLGVTLIVEGIKKHQKRGK